MKDNENNSKSNDNNSSSFDNSNRDNANGNENDNANANHSYLDSDVIKKALAEKERELREKLKEVTGFETLEEFKANKLKEEGKLKELLEQRESEINELKYKFKQKTVKAEIIEAATDAIDPEVVYSLLADKANVDEDGNVTIDGKGVKDAVSKLLETKKFLKKATGNAGSGSNHNDNTTTTEISRKDFDNLAPADRLKFVRSGGRITD